jgi:hypothetical protein
MQALRGAVIALLLLTWPAPAALALEIGLADVADPLKVTPEPVGGVGPPGTDLTVPGPAGHPSYLPVPPTWHDLEATSLAASALYYEGGGVWEGDGTTVAEPGTLALALLTALGGGGAVALTRRRGRRPSGRRRHRHP